MLAAAAVHDGNPLKLHWTPVAIGCLLYLSLAASVGATWLNYWLLERMSATALMSMALVEPFIAVLLGAMFLHERLTLNAAAGGVLVLCSIFMITISPPEAPVNREEEPHVKRLSSLMFVLLLAAAAQIPAAALASCCAS
jgi:drug/metabolite transporter (DMT)-like permease